MRLLEILGPWGAESECAFLVDLPTRAGGLKLRDLLDRPVIPLLRRDGLFGEIRVGRSPSANIRIAHGSVSNVHARMRLFPDGSWQIVDQESTNGTFVNGVRLKPGRPEPLAEGAIVKLGSKRYFFGSSEFQKGLQRLIAGRNSAYEPTLALPDDEPVDMPWMRVG
jgi:hypothetical protein